MNKSHLASEISLIAAGKKFNNRWIFKNIDFRISKSDRVAIIGNNGSGKSTLLQIIAGYVSPSEGNITWHDENGIISADKIYRHLSLASPYLELIEEFTLRENIDFFSRMKPLQSGCTTSDLISLSVLEEATERQVKYFSSGMKQRVKLALAILSDTGILLLDEPLSNLDSFGYQWYQDMLEKHLKERTLVVCSNNVADEIKLCTRRLNIEHFKIQSGN